MSKVILYIRIKDILRVSLLMGVLLLGIGLLWDMPASACGWLTPITVDSTGIVGKYPSMATDYNNKVHISYHDKSNNGLKYATNTSGSWANIGGLVGGKYTSIATDSNNKVHISYYNPTDHSLSYATNASGGWVKSILDSTDGKYTSIAIDSNNKVHISYYSWYLERLKYATNASGNWVYTIVESGLDLNHNYEDEPGTSIAIDSNNKVHISYLKFNSNDCITQSCSHTTMDVCKNTIKYATNKNGSWTTETVYSFHGDLEYVYRPSIAVDSNNKAHIAFTYCDLCEDRIYYATNASGAWITDPDLPPIPTWDGGYWLTFYAGLFPSISLDSNNKVHIMHSEWLYGRLWYTTNASGEWLPYDMDDGSGYVMDTAAAMDSGKLHTAYTIYNEETQDENLKYASCPNIPDLMITDINNPPASATRGSNFSVTDTTKNIVPPCGSGSTARTSVTRYRLSLDAIITTEDPLLTGFRAVPSLVGGASSTGAVMVTIPTSMPVGTYYLGACADGYNRISESNESNNCKASTTTIQVQP